MLLSPLKHIFHFNNHVWFSVNIAADLIFGYYSLLIGRCKRKTDFVVAEKKMAGEPCPDVGGFY